MTGKLLQAVHSIIQTWKYISQIIFELTIMLMSEMEKSQRDMNWLNGC